MFTGIIQAVGKLARRESHGGDLRVTVDATTLASRIDAARLAVGESVAVNGACLTVVAFASGCFEADVSLETLRVTTLGDLAEGSPVNLEAALRAGDPLGGHLMSGHVDGRAQVTGLSWEGRSLRLEMEAPAGLERYIAAKGSVALDGVSLTVNEVAGRRFIINLIPHTLEATNFTGLAVGRELNLEVDTLARYVERGLVQSRS
jgi:riboflavin synthase